MAGRNRWVVFGVVVGLLVALPIGAYASHLFDDVSDTSVHFDGIEFMKDSGVTVGCGGSNFCPQDNVTREQMGTFMYRLSGNDPATAPSVNATQIDGIDSSGLSQAVTIGFANNETVTLASDGTLHLTARCRLNFGGADAIDYFWDTDVAGTTTSFSTPLAPGPAASIFAGPVAVNAAPGALAYGLLVTGFGLAGPTGDTVTFLGSMVGVNVGGHDCLIQGVTVISPAA